MQSSGFISNNNFLEKELFLLNYKPQETDTEILIGFNTKKLNTKDIPQTLRLLQEHLPNIFYSKCFNPENLPFRQEAAQTELGHLFEHILLEYLSEESIFTYKKRLIFDGITTWNWKKEKKGVFHISLNVGGKDSNIFINSLEKSIILLEKILISN